MKGKPVVDYKNCMACGICVSVCPVSCLSLEKTDVDTYKKAYPVLLKGCIQCGFCERECPFDVITLQEA